MTDETLEKTFTWGRLTDEQRSTISQVFSVALEMARTVNRACPESREKALALTHIQNAVLWADAAIAIYGR